MLWDTILLALREIRRNVMRSFLTILGIVIGVASVITMVTLGGGATVQVTRQIASLGSNMLMVTPGKRMGPGQASAAPLFKMRDVDAVARDIRSLAAAAPAASRMTTAIFGNENWSTNVIGTDNQYLIVRNLSVRTGRQFSDSELRAGAAVCIIGDTVRKKLFGGQEPLGNRIRLGKLSFQIVGLLAWAPIRMTWSCCPCAHSSGASPGIRMSI
jgi:putative ABC transport system permease protein